MKVNSMNNMPVNKKDTSMIAIVIVTIVAGIIFTFMGIQITKLLAIIIHYVIDHWVIVGVVVLALMIFKRKIWDKK